MFVFLFVLLYYIRNNNIHRGDQLTPSRNLKFPAGQLKSTRDFGFCRNDGWQQGQLFLIITMHGKHWSRGARRTNEIWRSIYKSV